MSREHKHQKALIQYFKLAYPRYEKLLFSIPNGGSRDVREAVKLKAEGVTSGVPDLMLAVPTLVYPGLFIEMKSPAELGKPPGRLSKNQIDMISRLKEQGYRVEVCFGSLEAIEALDRYLA